MIANLSCLRLCRRIFIRAHLCAYVSSLSGANCIQNNHEYDQNPPNSSEYEAKIQSLMNKLHPETLISVLSSTKDLNSSLRLFKWASLQNQFRHTTDTYYHIIMRLGMASRVDEVEGFCNEMVKSGFSASEQALLSLIDCFIKDHKLDEALRVLFVLNSFSYKPSIALINRLLGVLVKEKKGLKSVLFVYKEMAKSSIFPTTETLNYLLEAFFDANRIDLVLDQYKRMQRKGCYPNSRTYEIMVSGLIGKNLFDESLVVLNEFLENGCDVESGFFSNILPLLFKVNKHEMGLRLFEKMKSSKIVPDLSVYEALIHYFSKNLCVSDAIDLLKEMISLDLKLSDCVFVDLVNGFCILNRLDEAKHFLDDLQVSEANSYNILLKRYCEVGNFDEVILLFQKMVEKNLINDLSWNILLRYFSENQISDTVYKILTKMIVSAVTPNSATYSALIIAKCKSNEVQDALNLFHRVLEEQWVVDSSCYATLIENLCQTDRIQEAVEVFGYMSSNKCKLRASAFSMLIMELCRKRKLHKVINLLPLAYYSGISCSNDDYNIIVKTMSNLSEINGLLAIVARMVIQGCPLESEAYNGIISIMSENHQAMECGLFLNRMINEGLVPDTEILFRSLSFLAKDFQLHTVLPTVHKLCSVSVSVSDQEVLNHAICNALIKGLWKEGYKREARCVLDLMLEKGWVPDSTTHQLLINSGPSKGCAYEKSDTQDEITNILSEGFGEV